MKQLPIAKSVLRRASVLIACSVLLVSFQNCGDINLHGMSGEESLSCMDVLPSTPSYTQIALDESTSDTVAFVMEAVRGESNFVKSNLTYQWLLTGGPDQIAQMSLGQQILLPEVRAVDCNVPYEIKASVQLCGQEISLPPVFYQHSTCPPPTTTTTTSTTTSTSTTMVTSTTVPPSAVPTTPVPGWSMPATRGAYASCPGEDTPQTVAEPAPPTSCQIIPGYNRMGITLNDANSDTEDFLSRGSDWNHGGQAGITCVGYSSNPSAAVATYNRNWIHSGSFYSLRIQPTAGESGRILFTDYNVGNIGMVSISECPGDFGEIVDLQKMREIYSHTANYAAPPVDQPNTLRRLYYQSNEHKQFNQRKTVTDWSGWAVSERCIAEADVTANGFSIRYHTDEASRVDSADAQGCRLQVGKTYYINFAPRKIVDNSPTGLNENPEWKQIIFSYVRSCRPNGVAGACPVIP